MQIALANRPDAGSTIGGSGGLRKVRRAIRASGKRRGVRIIYYWAVPSDQLLMLLIYSNSEPDDLTPDPLKTLKKIVDKEYA